MGFSVIVSKHVKDSKNDCSCEPTHAQVQQETSHGVSCSHCEAQRQDLLCSRSYLSRSLNHDVSPAQSPQLRCCLLGGDSRGRDSLRLDRGPSTEASVNQVGAQDDPSDRISTLDQLGNIRAGQGSRCQIRCRVGPHYRSRNKESSSWSLIKKSEASKALKNSCRIYSCMDISFIWTMIPLSWVSRICKPIFFVGDRLKFFLSAHKSGVNLNVLTVTAFISLVFILEDQVHPDLEKSHNLKIRKLTSHGRVGPQASSFKLLFDRGPSFR